MKCPNCKLSVPIVHRVNPLGEIGVFWCDKCLKKHESELYKNTQEHKQMHDTLVEYVKLSK